MLTYEYYFYGKVQKVSFRNTLKKISQKYQIKGYVENKSNGSVKAIFQQKSEILDEFLLLIRTFLELENKNILIRKITKKKINTNKKYDNFKIIYSSKINQILSKVHSIEFFQNKRKRKNIQKKSLEKIFPKHIVIIPDGNRRWRKKHGLNSNEKFYSMLLEKAEEIFQELSKQNLNNEIYFTLWGFSTENWNRSPEDIKSVFEGINLFLDHYLNSKKIPFKFKHLGRKDRLPSELLRRLNELEGKTQNNNSNLNFNLALDYGGRDEIIRAIRKISVKDLITIDEKRFAELLDTKRMPDADLIIRTSGEIRLSGMFPFQGVYSELYFTKKHFPEFTIEDFKIAIDEFNNRKRNFGK